MKLRPTTDIPRHRFPIEPWRLVETEPSMDDLGLTETLFAVGNGYIGMRDNPPEGRNAHSHGTFLNGFHETWRIHHAESAHAFAKTGQTIVNVPDAKLLKLYVDDEPLRVGSAELIEYERAIDFRTGVSHRDLLWRTPGDKQIRVRTERMVSLEHRHLATMRMTLTMEHGSAPIVVSSQLLNRQDGEDEYHVRSAALGEGDGSTDPRQGRTFDRRVLVPRLHTHQHRDDPAGGVVTLGYQAATSGMTLACAYQHLVDHDDFMVETYLSDDLAKSVFTLNLAEGQSVTITKFVTYHSSRGVPPVELADRCLRTLDRSVETGLEALYQQQQAWLERFWDASDIQIVGDDAAQQAIRWNLWQLAQASALTHESGIAAKAVTAGGYDGHYFWDTEVYVIPFLAATNPEAARRLLRFRYNMLPAACARAEELSQKGALYPWRTINGEEASAYYAAGTAQYHINAAVVYALERYVNATGDLEFLADEGAEILVETARLYEDLGFYSNNGDEKFQIHSVTGPDEYTTVVNNNAYTNVMARFVMRFAAQTMELLAAQAPKEYASIVRRTGVSDAEVAAWHRAADAMFIPYDKELGIHPQDDAFLAREPWDFEGIPAAKYPLLLNFHPLVIYRHQVLKQADVVLAMYLRGEHFDAESKRRNFDYYDPITTGDSSLSACVQAIVAAQVGHPELAWDYFTQALYLDLADTHNNTADGVHIANAGGIWAGVVHGFAGLVDNGMHLQVTPRLPAMWQQLTIKLTRHGVPLRIVVTPQEATIEVLDNGSVPVEIDDQIVDATAESPVTVAK